MTKAGTTPETTPDPITEVSDTDQSRTDGAKGEWRKVDGRWVAAAGMGIGSAALVAALLYANRNGRGPKTPG